MRELPGVRLHAGAVLLLWLAAAGLAAGQANASVVLQGSGSKTAAELLHSILRNASTVFSGQDVSLPFTDVESPIANANFLTEGYDYSVSLVPLNSSQYRSANRAILQVPFALSVYTVAHTVPGIGNGQLSMNPAVLAGIYQCNITRWDDPAITALNPGLQLPHANITPVAYTENVGTTQIFLQYLQLDGTWSLGVGNNFQAPACVQHASLWQGVLNRTETVPYSLGYIEYKRMVGTNLTTVALRNPSGAYVAPTFKQNAVPVSALPAALASPDWERVQLTGSSSYPFVGLVYLIVNQDIARYGEAKARALKQLVQYFLSSGVQSNVTAFYYAPMSADTLNWERGQVDTLLNTTRTVSASGKPGASLAGTTLVSGSGDTTVEDLMRGALANATVASSFAEPSYTYNPVGDQRGAGAWQSRPAS